ncbi:DUF3006 domain-containing protein [bacterium CG_4_10_14_0_2_um_filter_33_32]|nr:MAG: DUF3006 domain-containing protein [bacterium CG10_big_fil_rev_8_21_14_0_10_33_18]PIU76385.1 MAG: DUF3006 domain-containing protein [bacterium CG06_land_8_20_14_3_00_33_50]PIW81271.1 MAG: DUF3006 domain-containing protein [bacterium CG_4_8_14_3_um_filter_33_28]PIY85694.1 MAG: DUF3006 domain-containing protein [bacterium CG_4_10_14_0_8_um_filter_33_57]PIZ85842.1 MAG: DUF3006 domain-containing protein [bacterium CG_4_10_14_0_2_um_filter_33_32]PJA72656.1 MAG: DUF3006 domain-containing prot
MRGVIDRFEKESAVIILKDHQIIYWPTERLPEESKEGDVVWIRISQDQDLTKEREKLARKILEEILNGTENKE